MKKRILSLLLVLVMLLSLLPAGVLAAEGDVSVTLSGLFDTQVNSLKLYTYTGGTKGTKDLLAETQAADRKYTIDLAPGAYWVDGYDANGDCNGGVSIDVSSENKSFKLQRMYQISVSPSDWVKGTDYTLSLRVTDASGAERKAEFGSTVDSKGQTWESTRLSCLFVVGDTVSVTATPDEKLHPDYNPAAASKTPTMNDSLSLTCNKFVTVKVTAPEGSTIDAGTLTKYYVFSFMEPITQVTEDTTGETSKKVITATFRFDENTDYFYRVRHPQGATYWNYVKLSKDAAYTVTEADLGLDGKFSKNTIYHFENNIYDRAGIYLNINPKGYKNMAVGEMFELNSFRNWFAIKDYVNDQVALPEMHYQVIDVNGNPSDVVSITPNELNSNVAVMKAEKAGTAIVLVTYDAMTFMTGQTSTDSHRFSAIWPELTGVFVVNVGADGSAIQTNMKLDRMDATITKDEARQLDAEHDILFYTGTEGASFSFKPEDGCDVSVLHPTVSTTAMTYIGGFQKDDVSVAEDGTVTVSKLTTGRHIIKVTKTETGLSTYQVVTARGVSYKLVDKDGKELTDEAKAAIRPGDSVTIQFSNLISPKEKLSGAYNFNFSLYMQGPDGTFFKSDPGGSFGVYDFSGNPERQKLTVTIPKYWSVETYPLTGAIKLAGWPGVPTHRGVTYAKGTDRGFGAPSTADILSRLPEVAIPVQVPLFLTGKLVFQDQGGTSIDRKNLTVTLKDSAGNTILVANDGTFQSYAEEYFYTVSGAGIEYATGSVTMTAEGENTFPITLQATAAGAWDGTTQTEPTQVDGVYQIGTGAELAWFVAKSKDADVSGVLTADINLSKYAWPNISSSKKVELNGEGREITGLNAATGLFAQIGAKSSIHDLTIRGTVSGKGNAGAIVGYACGAGIKIERCFNYASITSTGNNVGGLVGYTYQNAVIKDCANFGPVTGASKVGGILGGSVGNNNTVTGCYNTADVTATSGSAGGILGGSGYALNVESCYNTGKLSGTASGGIAGEVKGNVDWSGTVQGKITFSSCYSTGEAGSPAFGTVDAASSEISKCYYLSTLGKDPNAEPLSDDDLKNADLSAAFAPVCRGGYPALMWQKNVTFHEANGKGTVTAPLCTEKGYTSYSCSKCGESYRTAYVAALGHDFCEDTEGCKDCKRTSPTCTETGKIVRTCRRDGCMETKTDTIPATGHTPTAGTEKVFTGYKTYTCSVCGKTYKKWDDDRIGHVSYPEQTVASISASDASSYPWVYNSELERFESSNQEQNKTSSTTSFAFTLSAPTVLKFGYGVSSEANCDKLTITLAKDGSTETLVNGISGSKADSVNRQLEAGSYTLTLSYVKDAYDKDGSDMAYVSVLTLAGMAHVIVENTTFPTTKGAAWDGTLVDTWLELKADSTMMNCIFTALGNEYKIEESKGYISSINGLEQMAGGPASGWMGTLNDWFTNFGFSNFTVANGALHAGDEIRVMYTRTAEDLGGSWNSTDTRLKALKFSAGKLSPAFSGDVTTYTLTVPQGTTLLRVTPTAANKNYQVHTYLGTQAEGREYARASLIPVQDGSVITVVSADESWPTMNVTNEGELKSDGKRTYTITVKYGSGDEAKSDDADITSVTVAGAIAIAGEGNAYTVTVPSGTEVTANSFNIKRSDSKATVGALTNEGNVWSFTVTAEDGTTAKTYTVTVATAAPKSTDAGVSSISVAHTPASKTGETAYTVKLQTNAEVTAGSFQIVLSDEKASITAGPTAGENGVWRFTVTAEDGKTTAEYTVTVTRRSASEKKPLRTVSIAVIKGQFEGVNSTSTVVNATAESNIVMIPYRLQATSANLMPKITISFQYPNYTASYTYTKSDGTAATKPVNNGTGFYTVKPTITDGLIGVITLTSKTDASDVWVYELRMPTEANHAPKLKDGVITPAAASINLGESYQFDMTQIFEDEDSYDKLTYRVWRNTENPFYVPASYTYKPSAAGVYTLVFKASDSKAESPEYKFVLTVIDPNAKSTDAGVTSVKVAGVTAASGENNAYTVTVPYGTDVTADSFEITRSDNKSSITAGPTKGEDGVWSFTVTAEDGTTSKTYTVTVSSAAAPKSNNADVSSVKVANVTATAGENNSYTVTVPYGTTVTASSFEIVKSDAGATVGALTHEGNVWTFTVTAEDGTTAKTYTVTVSSAAAPKSNNADVSSVKVANVTATAGENNSYTVTVPYGTTVTASSFEIVKSDAGATVGALTHEGNVWTFTVTAEDGTTSKTYTVTVSFAAAPKSSNADVASVKVANVTATAGENNSYTVTVPYGTNVTSSSFAIVPNHSGATVGALTRSGNVWSFTVTAEDGTTSKTYTVTVSTASLPIPVKPATDNTKPASRLPFTDVSTSDWFYDDVKFVYENGLFSGTDSRSFSPSASMTRAMLVTVLYRLEGEPAVAGRSSFADVRSGAYYEKAVIWAAANGIVTGTSSTSFSPDAKVTREQLAAILYRYAQYKKLDTSASEKLNSFSDAGEMSGYANAALGWAVAERLVNGASGKLMPKGYATRAQVAAIFHRFVENVVK